MAQLTQAEEHFVAALAAAGLKVKPSYTLKEVGQILDISERQVQRMTAEHSEVDGEPISAKTLDSFTLGIQKRVRFQELVDWMERNRTINRQGAAAPFPLGIEKARGF